MSIAKKYMVAGAKPWTRGVFDKVIADHRGEWHYDAALEHPELDRPCKLAPRNASFLHWSWTVPGEVFGGVRCVR